MNTPTFPTPASINLIPEPQIFTNTVSYRPWYLFWLFVFNIKREILVWYNVSDKSRLEVNFKKNKGYRTFPSKAHAEKWLDADIEISDYVGEIMSIKNIQLTNMIKCDDCGHALEPKDIAITIEGPETEISRYRYKSSHHNDVCEQCGSNKMVSIIVPR